MMHRPHYTIMPDHLGAYAWVNTKGTDTLGPNHADVGGWPGDPPISEGLHRDFAAWHTRFEKADLHSEVGHSGGGVLDWAEFHADGLELARRLKRELGDLACVFYQKPREDPDFQVEHRREVLADGSVIVQRPRHAGPPWLPRKVVSGGQTGADRAALDWAFCRGIDHGGWCPKGRLAADGPLPPKYRLQETESDGYQQRTKLNVRDSEATLVFNMGELEGGTLQTLKFAETLKRPHQVFQLDAGEVADVAEQVRAWLDDGRYDTLNVAGPREEKRPGIYARAMLILDHIADD